MQKKTSNNHTQLSCTKSHAQDAYQEAMRRKGHAQERITQDPCTGHAQKSITGNPAQRAVASNSKSPNLIVHRGSSPDENANEKMREKLF